MGARQARLRTGAEGRPREAAELQVAADAPPRQRPPRPCPPPRDRPQGVKAYVKARKTIPEPDHPKAKTEGDTIFERLVEEVEKPAKRERPENSWIRPSTWSLVDQRAAMRKEGTLGRREAQYLGRKIKASIKEDRKHRAKRAGEAIMAALEEGNWREA